MRKWWRRFKNKQGWDFKKTNLGVVTIKLNESGRLVKIEDPNGCYKYKCRYCMFYSIFPWSMTHLFYHNMQRHIKAKHIDTL